MIDTCNKIKQKSKDIGFEECCITKPELPASVRQQYEQSLTEGRHASMHYLERNIDKRTDPVLFFPEAKSVIVLLYSYNLDSPAPKSDYRLSKYASIEDYHIHIKNKLEQLDSYLKTLIPGIKTKINIDAGAVAEKRLAANAGLGWIGKNTILINRVYGSFFFLSEIFTNAELVLDKQLEQDKCGTCTACIDACPTKALQAYKLDARKCISYHTIESKDEIPSHISDYANGYIFGCDICQNICPWNKKALKTDKAWHFIPPVFYTNEQWENLTNDDFNKDFVKSSAFRTGFKKISQTIRQIKKGAGHSTPSH